jgi:hypothetical protein
MQGFLNTSYSANKISTFIPPFEQAFSELASFYIQLYSSLEEAVRLALKYFEDLKAPVDVYLLNDLIRYNTKRLLKRKTGVHLEEDYEIGDLSNNGLIGTCKGYNIRILKSYKGDLPLINSEAKAAYFSQQLRFIIGDSILPASRPNIAFVWDLSEKYALEPLRMCCPEYAEKYRGILSVYYNELLPHPAEIIKTKPGVLSEVKDIEIQSKESVDGNKNTTNIWGENQAGPGTQWPDSK